MTIRDLLGQWITLGTNLWLFRDAVTGDELATSYPGRLYRSGNDRFVFRTPGGSCHFLEGYGFPFDAAATPGGVPYGNNAVVNADGTVENGTMRLVPGPPDGWPPNVPHESVFKRG